MADFIEAHGKYRRKCDHKYQFLHHTHRIHFHTGAYQDFQCSRYEKRCQYRVDNHQRKRKGTVTIINRYPHQTDHSRRHGKLQHHSCDIIGISGEQQMSDPAGNHRYQHMKDKKHQDQRKRSFKHIRNIPKPGFQRSDKSHKRKRIRYIRNTMLRNIRKEYSHKETHRCHKSHPFLYKTVKFFQHTTPLYLLRFL